MRNGQLLKEQIKYAAADFAFANDNRTLFYIKLQPGLARSYRLMKHVMGTDPKADKLI